MIKQLLMNFLTSAVASAPAAAAEAEGQLELFPEPEQPPAAVPGIPVGAIVMPLINEGYCSTSYLYFQVRQAQTNLQAFINSIAQEHPKWNEKQRAEDLAVRLEGRKKMQKINGVDFPPLEAFRYQISAVPYGFRISNSWTWLEEHLLFDTGLRWRVPDQRELDLWSQKANPWPKDAAGGKGGYDRWFLSTYHTPMNGSADRPDVPIAEKQRWHYDNRPYPGEKELVRMLESLHDSDIRIYPRWDQVMHGDEYERWIDENVLVVHKRNLERRRP